MATLYPLESGSADPIVWHDVKALNILEGQGWNDTESAYDRLPARMKGIVSPATWSQSQASSGLCLRFLTDSPHIRVRWTLTGPVVSQMHMPATAVSGVDFYRRQPSDGRWIFSGNGRPTPDKEVQEAFFNVNRGVLVHPQECLLYFPLYNGVQSMEIGIPADKSIMEAPPYPKGHGKPIVFNGHSIVQGGCASRPGMSATAIVGRRLNVPVLNLGFSAAGHMEPEIAGLLGEIDALIYVIDTLTNMNSDMIRKRAEPFIRQIRQARPHTPIVLVGAHHGGTDVIGDKELLAEMYRTLKSDGVEHLYYLSGVNMLGRDGEATVDGTHLTDLGFMRQADVYASVLKPLILLQKFRQAGDAPESVMLDMPPLPRRGMDYVRDLLDRAESSLAENRAALESSGNWAAAARRVRETRTAMETGDYAGAIELLCLDTASDFHRALRKDVMTEFVAEGWKRSRLLPKTGIHTSLCEAPPAATDDAAMEFTALDPEMVNVSGLVNLHSLFGEEDGIVYLALKFDAPLAGAYRLGLGHDGGVRAWVNGEPVLCVPERQNPCFADRSTALLDLPQGRHELMVAFDTAQGMGWGIRFRFLSPDGQPQIMAAFPAAVN